MATIRWCPIFPKWDSYQPLCIPAHGCFRNAGRFQRQASCQGPGHRDHWSLLGQRHRNSEACGCCWPPVLGWKWMKHMEHWNHWKSLEIIENHWKSLKIIEIIETDWCATASRSVEWCWMCHAETTSTGCTSAGASLAAADDGTPGEIQLPSRRFVIFDLSNSFLYSCQKHPQPISKILYCSFPFIYFKSDWTPSTPFPACNRFARDLSQLLL